MTAGATPGQSHESRGDGFRPVGDVFNQPLLGKDTAFVIETVIAIIPAGDALSHGRIRQKIAGQLLGDELIIGHVVVEGGDHPIAPRPHCPKRIALVPIAVGIAGRIEPTVGHVLAKTRRGQKTDDDGLEGLVVRARVSHEGIGFLWGRRQTGEIQSYPPDQGLSGRQR